MFLVFILVCKICRGMLWGNYQIYLMILYGILFLSDITDKIYEFMDLNRETQPDRSVAELFQQYVLLWRDAIPLEPSIPGATCQAVPSGFIPCC